MSEEVYNVKYNNNQAYVRYENGVAYLFMPTGNECIECCPTTFSTLWEHPNIACQTLAREISLTTPYWHFPSGAIDGQENKVPANGFSALCGNPPTTNLSKRIQIQIPYDPIFSGTYIFDWTGTEWVYRTGVSSTSLSKYNDINSVEHHDKYLISLKDTLTEPTYKGYVEVARSGAAGSNISGVYAFPSQFVFSAIDPPSDASSQTPFPTDVGHRAVFSFMLPIRWRHEYNDWVITDKVGHKISGIANSPSGYATAYNGSSTVSLSGITNSPPNYNLSDITTAITGSCTGIAYLGFAYKTSGVGLPFDNATYGTNINNFTGIRPEFKKLTVSYNSTNYTLDETQLFVNKTPIEAWVSFPFSCRTSGTICNDFDILSPVATGYTNITASCLGAYINADFACKDSIARPSGQYFTNESVTTLKVVYSGIPENVYPLVKTTKTTANLYKASSNQVIYIDYTGAATPEALREWINKEFNFVQTTGVNNNISYIYPGVDLYWDTTPTNGTPGTAWARLIPCDSAAFESGAPGLYILSIDGKFGYESGASDLIGQYGHDSTTNRYINLNNGNGNYQIRFILNKWHLGKIENGSFVTHYTMEYTTGGIPSVLVNNFTSSNDYSDFIIGDTGDSYTWNELKTPVTCKSAPIGEWISIDTNTYPGTAISIRDPLPVAWNEGNSCGS
jgi:hypothetical protein